MSHALRMYRTIRNPKPFAPSACVLPVRQYSVSARPMKPIESVPCFRTSLTESFGFRFSLPRHTPSPIRNG